MWFMALIALSVMVTGDYRKKMPKMGDNHYLCAAFAMVCATARSLQQL
jgi:hypothetical protein